MYFTVWGPGSWAKCVFSITRLYDVCSHLRGFDIHALPLHGFFCIDHFVFFCCFCFFGLLVFFSFLFFGQNFIYKGWELSCLRGFSGTAMTPGSTARGTAPLSFSSSGVCRYLSKSFFRVRTYIRTCVDVKFLLLWCVQVFKQVFLSCTYVCRHQVSPLLVRCWQACLSFVFRVCVDRHITPLLPQASRQAAAVPQQMHRNQHCIQQPFLSCGLSYLKPSFLCFFVLFVLSNGVW